MPILKPSQAVNVLDVKSLNSIPEVTRITCLADVGAYEAASVTLPTTAAATNADYLHIVNKTGTKYAIWLDKTSEAEVFTVTLPATAAAAQGDYFAFENPAALKTAVWLDIDLFETFTATFPTTAAATQADYLYFVSPGGVKTAVWLDIDANGTAPTGPLYAGADLKLKASIVAGGLAVNTALAAATALTAQATGFTFVNNLDGTITFTASARGTATDAIGKSADDVGAGSIVPVVSVQGTAATPPSGAVYVAATNKIKATIATGDDATAVATKVFAAIGATVTGFSKVDNLDGTLTFTSLTRGLATNAAPHNTGDTGNGSVTIVIDNEGVAAVVPTGALYLASNHQIKVEIVTGGTAISNAALMKAAVEANGDWDEFTITNMGGGVLKFTSTLLGNLTNAAPKKEDDSAAGSIAVSISAGVASNLQNKYFIMRNPAATVYNGWFNVSGEGVDPNPAGTEIACALTAGGTAAAIAAEIATAINANSNFKAWVQENYLYVANEAEGVAVDVTAGNSGFTVTKIQDGKAGYFYPAMAPSSLVNEPSLIS